MRILMMLVLMVVSGSAWADALKIKVKAKNKAYEHRYDNRAGWDWRRPSWSLFYSTNGHHHGHKRYSGNKRHHSHYSVNRGQHKQQRNWRSADQSHSHYSGNRDHGKQQINWLSADQFRTRRSNKSEPVIFINAEVSAISLRGIKRHAAIYDVYAELGNGRIIPLRNLEGSLHSGESFTMHFKDSRYVTKVFLHVGPVYRHQRAYVSVDYLPANSPEGG